MKSSNELMLNFQFGTIVFQNKNDQMQEAIEGIVFDKRTLEYRCQASRYREIIIFCRENNIKILDEVKQYKKNDFQINEKIIPRHHQKLALDSWVKHGMQGVVSLPTGAGKTILAILAIQKVCRSTLIVVPTLDLVDQWKKVLAKFFNNPIGQLGGGEKLIEEITVSTFDTARLMIEKIGNQFGFLIIDECHHLPADQNQLIARASVAPFRLGLSATVERADGGEEIIYQLLGDLVYQSHIHEMTDGVLAPYEVVQLEVDLTQDEKKDYEFHRQKYLDFIRKQRINFSQPGGWKNFVFRSSQSADGKLAMLAFRKQKKIAQSAQMKFEEIWRILNTHSGDQIIIFTDDNELAYRIGKTFFLGVITHKTRQAERKILLEQFRNKELKTLVTSKVLNEGVDVPSASIGVVVSGSGAVREHVQRLGRILRNNPGKRAFLYEIVAKNTSESYVNQRRRQHDAYQRST